MVEPDPKRQQSASATPDLDRTAVGGRMPAIARIKVDLPEPLEPMMPIAVPVRTWKVTCLIASISLTERCLRPKRIKACFGIGLRSNVVR